MVAGDPLQRWWRPVYGFELTAECAIMWALVMYDLLFGEQRLANFIPTISTLLTVYWGTRFGVLGVYAAGRTIEKKAALDSPLGQLAPSIIDQIVKAMRKK
jgi:hypothetical protein